MKTPKVSGCLLWILTAAGGLCLGAAPALPAQERAADSADRVVIRVGEHEITAGDVESILQSLPPQNRMFYQGEGRNQLPQFLVRMKLLVDEARRQKLEEDPETRRKMEFAAESVLAEAARQRLLRSGGGGPEQLAALYEQVKPQLLEVRLRRILLRTENSIYQDGYVPSQPGMNAADARKKLEELRAHIVGGADFADVAREHSDDTGSGQRGGDMGFVSPQTLLPPVAQAALKLQPGEVSEIIPTPFGLELIQVVEKRYKPLEEVRPMLEAQLGQGSLEEKLQMLQAEVQDKIFVDEAYFASPAQAQPAGPASPR